MFVVYIPLGQQAHVPTNFSSGNIYYTRYSDCGDGVMEVDYLMHNGDSSDSTDTWNYLNVPWGGVRTSTLADVLVLNSGETVAEQIEPIPAFGPTGIVTYDGLGGYTTFVEDLPLMATTIIDVPFPTDDNTDVSSVVLEISGSCSESTSHSAGTIWRTVNTT